MRALYIALIPLLCAAQSRPAFLRDTGRIGVESTLRTNPPNSRLQLRFSVLNPRVNSTKDGPTFFSRILLDSVNHTYFGYELFIEQLQPGSYHATFANLAVSPLDLAGNGNLKFSFNPDGSTNLNWTLRALPEIPKPRLINDGDILTLDLFIDPSTGDKLTDEIRIVPPLRISGFVPVPLGGPRTPISAPPVPTVSGIARDFSVADADLQVTMPRDVTLNGVRQGPIPIRDVHGNLIWIYIPDHGRYVLSLTPRPGLNFQKIGEVRGGVLTFTVGKDTITLECPAPIAPGGSAYHLYVLHDADWEPVSAVQKLVPRLGSVSAAELSALKPK